MKRIVSDDPAHAVCANEQRTYTNEGKVFQLRNVVAEPLPFDTTQITSPGNVSHPKAGDPCHPLASTAHPPAVVFKTGHFTRGKSGAPSDVAFTLQRETDRGDQDQVVAVASAFNIAPGKGALKDDIHVTIADATKTLDAVGSNPAMHQGGAAIVQPVAVDTYNQTLQEDAIAIRSAASDVCHTGGVINPSHRMAVRRLTPVECERLQGFPDNFTRIAWRGKAPEECPDGPRYKALGNSMAVPCMRWIGQRIAALDSGPLAYLSVCSGIEAASVAWEPLGWRPEAFSEIEPFPAAVLAHHFPHVPNLGDMTKHENWNIGAISILAGGTPCQSFSVAGLRQGLSDPRGSLMLTYLAIAERHRPRWIVWENVPGVLSSNRGRDFGSFIGALAKLGYGWAYRVLDARWFGVAQRRRRVFVVGHLGEWTHPAKVLFESESLCRDFEKGAKARKAIAPDARGSIEESGRWPADVAATLRKENGGPGYANQDLFAQKGANLVPATIAEHEFVGTLSDGAHRGGGHNGQDVYTGRIMAVVEPEALQHKD